MRVSEYSHILLIHKAVDHMELKDHPRFCKVFILIENEDHPCFLEIHPRFFLIHLCF